MIGIKREHVSRHAAFMSRYGDLSAGANMDSRTIQEIAGTITTDRCTELAVRLVDIPSLTGNEQPIAECVHAILGEMGAHSYMQEFEPARYNTIGRLRGRNGGATLLLNGHMDIAFNGTEQYLPKGPGYQPKAVVKDGWIYGMGVHNMKGGCAAFLAAAEAIRKSGIDVSTVSRSVASSFG